jgi:hypothetical protein
VFPIIRSPAAGLDREDVHIAKVAAATPRCSTVGSWGASLD